MPRTKLCFVTLRRLNRALTRVTSDLDQHGLWDERVQAVPVYLASVGYAHGWQCYGGSGEICVPAVSLVRLGEYFHGPYTSLADVLRHEYGHALADTHRGLFRSRQFSSVFGSPHDSEWGYEYDPDLHVSSYAATDCSEDFAETFMLYLKHGGQLPARFDTKAIRAKWQFVEQLGNVVKRGLRRWRR